MLSNVRTADTPQKTAKNVGWALRQVGSELHAKAATAAAQQNRHAHLAQHLHACPAQARLQPHLDSMADRSEVMLTRLVQRGGELPLLMVVLDAHSFGQTALNAEALGWLHHGRRVELHSRSANEGLVVVAAGPAPGARTAAADVQFVLHLDMRTWEAHVRTRAGARARAADAVMHM